MESRETKRDDRDLDRELERYRQAAWDALDQLDWCINFDWCINYLHRIRKDSIAKGIERNRLRIMERIR
jgi:hypothetical protein